MRNISNPRGVTLLYDVLQYEPSDIKRAVLFVTNNSLVCETPEDAMKVAYEMEDDAVAMDGTFYQKSEIISGVSVDLARKAKRWDDKQLSGLKSRKEKLSEDLRLELVNLIDSFAVDGFRLNNNTKILGPCVVFPTQVLCE